MAPTRVPGTIVSGMTEDTAEVPSEWTEANIIPTSWEHRERLLLDVVDPLVHEVLNDRVDDWHYFWEPALRLRIRWQEPTHDGVDKLTSFLDEAKADGKLASWQTGSHGNADQTYAGEASDYGLEVWEQTYKDWTSGSELALSIVKHGSAKDLSKPRFFHWHRRVHLFSNELGVDFCNEGCWALDQANGYLAEARARNDPRATYAEISALIDEIADKTNQLGHAVQRWMSEQKQQP